MLDFIEGCVAPYGLPKKTLTGLFLCPEITDFTGVSEDLEW